MSTKGVAVVVATGLLVAGGVVWMSLGRSGHGRPAVALEPPLFQQQDPPLDIAVYYVSDTGALEPESRVIFKSAQRLNQMKQALLEALKPPVEVTHAAVVPEGVALRELYVDAQGTAYVDCSAELIERHPGGSTYEWYTVQALAAALIHNFEEVKAVRFLVEGRPVDTLKGHVELTSPIGVDSSWFRAPLAVTLP